MKLKDFFALVVLTALVVPVSIAEDVKMVPDYIEFHTYTAGDTGFTGKLYIYNYDGELIAPMEGNLTIEVYDDRDYHDKLLERFFEVGNSSGWDKSNWRMPRIAFDDIGEDLTGFIYIRAIFRSEYGEFSDKTFQSTS